MAVQHLDRKSGQQCQQKLAHYSILPGSDSAAASVQGLAKFASNFAGLSDHCIFVNSCFVHVLQQQVTNLHSSFYPVVCVPRYLMYTEH